MEMLKLFGGIEAGGTKFICGVGSGKGELIDRVVIPTTTPEETLGRVIDFFESKDIAALGIGTFGPLELNSKKENFGSILESTKKGWTNVNIKNILSEALNVPTIIATDTDVSAIGEQFFGKSVGIKNFVYVTIGTGIGGSIIINNEIVHGTSHPEIGHIRVPNHSLAPDKFGSCKYHRDCLEGLASGAALEILYSQKAETIVDSRVWDLEAQYIAYGLVGIISTIQPEIIILGGSVMKQTKLIDNIRKKVLECINGYFDIPPVDDYIVHCSSDSIGVLGAIKLGSYGLENKQ